MTAGRSKAEAGSAPPPPTPPPPPPGPLGSTPTPSVPSIKRPIVAPTGPGGSFLVELITYNGAPFKDHWAYWVRSQSDPDIGVQLHATGDVRNGFSLEFKRSHDLRDTGNIPSTRIPLQWVDGRYFDEKTMLNNGIHKLDTVPVCMFEASASKVDAPGKTLNSISTTTWIVESADQLVKDGIFKAETAAYLRSVEQ
ncbi:hypothetical protein MAA_03178 [Metarhizium robertsii ARSEF 23]|uniref:Uncharacterized protein n=1 Tax=Metarhizium robertsii (strain ARSEF 23 / ATCC MYA-3075) TaxID=655844 RepID=E9ESS6_METRA|nr:uncharacterized protein MAA_03178 [Metarhizium robertsii ARSEF 23]EFZ01949.1 hypothetical protein MAA_03178 [Metarhizium robertsii ARSEF 23]